jgi:hypothetical protein
LYRDTLKRIVWGVIRSTVGWALAWIHVLLFDRLFLRQAKIPDARRRARRLSRTGDGTPQP